MLKVVLVDDAVALQRSLSRMLGAIPGVELVGVAGGVAEALNLIDAVRPDVVLLDVNLPHGERGIDVLLHVNRMHAQTDCVVLTNAVAPKLRQLYLDTGARAYFDKASEFNLARAWIAARANAQQPSSST